MFKLNSNVQIKYISSNFEHYSGYYWWLRNCIKFNRTMHNKYATVWKVHSLIVRKPHTGSNWHFALPDWLRTNKLILEGKYTVLGDAPGFAREIMLGESEVWNIPHQSCVPCQRNPRHSSACGLSLLPPFIAITFSHIK